MRVLLISPPHDGYIKPQPIGLMSLGAVLRASGHMVRIIDGVTHRKPATDIARCASDWKADIVGISCITWTSSAAYEIGRHVRLAMPSVQIIYGGVHPTLCPEEPFLEGEADVVVRGEAENLIVDLVEGRSLDNVAVVTSRSIAKQLAAVQWQPSSWPDLASLPLPAYDLVSFKEYTSSIHVPELRDLQAVDVMATRGCPYSCTFCAIPTLYGRSVRKRPVDSVLDEISEVYRDHGVRCVHFYDDDFLLSSEYALQIARGIEALSVEIAWICQARVDSVLRMSAELDHLKRCGCLAIELGVEAAEVSSLQGMRKQSQPHQGLSSARLIRDAGIRPIYLTLSYAPGETLNGAYRIFDLISRAESSIPWDVNSCLDRFEDTIIYGHLMTPLIGSQLHNDCARVGRNLIRHNDDMYLERVNFLPDSLIRDVPARSNELDRDRFTELVEFCVDRGIYAGKSLLEENSLRITDVVDWAEGIHGKCDGESPLSSLHHLMCDQDAFVPLELTAACACLLSAGGYIHGSEEDPTGVNE